MPAGTRLLDLYFTAWHQVRVYIQGPDPGIDFLVDDISLREIPENPYWRQEANQRIENFRKSNFTLRLLLVSFFCPLYCLQHHIMLNGCFDILLDVPINSYESSRDESSV